jgi:hypothetical protein
MDGFAESVHPWDPDAYEVRWDHNAHEHFLVVPRELLADGKTWINRHALRINSKCAEMYAIGGGDGRS